MSENMSPPPPAWRGLSADLICGRGNMRKSRREKENAKARGRKRKDTGKMEIKAVKTYVEEGEIRQKGYVRSK